MADGAAATSDTSQVVGQQDSGGIVDAPLDSDTGTVNLAAGEQATGTFTSAVTQPVVQSEAATKFFEMVGDEYKDETFIKEIANKEKPIAELAKMYKNINSLMGKQSAAAAAVVAGVPEKADGYMLKPVEWEAEDKEIGASVEKNRDPEFMKYMMKVAHDNKINEAQFQAVVENFEKFSISFAKKEVARKTAEAAKYDAEFDEEMTKKFGHSVGQMKEIGRGIIGQLANDEEKAAFRTFSNPQAVALASFLKKLNDKYIQADGFSGTGRLEMSGQETQSEILELMAKPPYSNNDFQDPNYDKTVAKVNAFFGTNQKKK